MSAYTYICSKGHVTPAPSMGDLVHCGELLPVYYAGAVRGHAPCGCPIVKVAFDDGVECAYRVGGAEAVMDLLRARIGSPALVQAYDSLVAGAAQ